MEELLLFFREMSNYELYDSYLNVRSLVATDNALLLSLFFAYVGVALFVGSKLTQLQRVIVSSLYSLAYFQMVYGVYEGMMQMALVVYAWTDEQWRLEFILIWAYAASGVWICAWAVSLALFFMRNTPDAERM
jgi:hypothetical protein